MTLPIIQWDQAFNRNGDAKLPRQVGNAIRTYMDNQTLEGWVRAETLMADTGLAESSVWRQIARLIEAGWLIVVNPGSHSGRKANVYRLTYPTNPRVCARVGTNADAPNPGVYASVEIDKGSANPRVHARVEPEIFAATNANPRASARVNHRMDASPTTPENYSGDRTTPVNPCMDASVGRLASINSSRCDDGPQEPESTATPSTLAQTPGLEDWQAEALAEHLAHESGPWDDLDPWADLLPDWLDAGQRWLLDELDKGPIQPRLQVTRLCQGMGTSDLDAAIKPLIAADLIVRYTVGNQPELALPGV